MSFTVKTATMSLWPAFLIVFVLTCGMTLTSCETNTSPSSVQRESVGYFCFGQMCRCTNTSADCSRNNGTLEFVPQLPKGIQFLNFSYNNLVRIDSDDFFANVTSLRSIDLGNNNLTFISAGAFRPLHKLTALSLIYNNLNYSALHPVLSVATLRKLDVRYCNLPTPPPDVFRMCPMPELQVLYMHGNDIEEVDLSVFAPLKNLRNLGLAENWFNKIKSFPLPKLEKLNLKSNAMRYFPETCLSKNKNSFFPELVNLLLRGNIIRGLTQSVCLPKLQVLDISENPISEFASHMFSDEKFPALLQLYAESMHVFKIRSKRFAFWNRSLKKLSLMYNNLPFDERSVDAESLAGCPNLTTLQISHNYITDMSEDKFIRMFGNLTSLQRLYMGQTYLSRITSRMVRGFKKLETLSLNQNRLSRLGLPGDLCGVLPRLTRLDLNRNQISVVTESTFSPCTRLRHLDLSGNPFTCSCELLWFQNLLKTSASLFRNSWTSYECHNLRNTSVIQFSMANQACLLSSETSAGIVAVCFVMIFILLSAAVVYRYRWHIRLMMQRVSRARSFERWQRLHNECFRYDVFVSYAHENEDFVMQHLVPELEGRLGLRLCLHKRDFIPGKGIIENISDCVEASKKVLVIFSTDFARSPWCQFELSLSLSYVLDNDDSLVVVSLHDIPSRDLTSAMMAVINTTTYIRWENDQFARNQFWVRMRLAMSEILPPGHV